MFELQRNRNGVGLRCKSVLPEMLWNWNGRDDLVSTATQEHMPTLREAPMSNQARIINRVRGREASQQIRELIGDDFGNRDFMEAFVEQVQRDANLIDERPPIVKVEPIARLGSHTLDYGEFKGRCLDDIPLARIDWYLRKAEENVKILRAYMKHPGLESRRSAEIGEPL